MSTLGSIRGLWDAAKSLGLRTQISAALYPYRKAYYDAKFADDVVPIGDEPAGAELAPRRQARRVWGSRLRGIGAALGLLKNRARAPSLTCSFPGRLLSCRRYSPDADALIPCWLLTCENALIQIAVLAPDLVRIRASPTGHFAASPGYAIFFRNHTATGTGDQEPFALGEPCEQISRRYIELRYRLLPYLYTAFWQSAQSGMPMMRPLFLVYQDEPYTAGIEDQFLFGDAFLVAPILNAGHTSRPVYLPRGRWYNAWDDSLTAGPQIARLDAPLDRLPLLVRAGSVVPAWPLMQHTGERPVDVLTLHVYPGTGESVLYEDDGHTWAFQGGEYQLTRLRCETKWASGSTQPLSVRLERTSEGLLTPSYKRLRIALHGLAAAPREVTVDGHQESGGRFVPDAHLVAPDPSHPPFVLEIGAFETIEVQMQ